METEHWRMNFIINNKFDDDWWISLILYEKWVFMNDELSYVYFLLWNFLHMTLDQGSIFKNRLWFQKISIFLQKHFKISWICSKKIKIFLEICHCGKNLSLWQKFATTKNNSYDRCSAFLPTIKTLLHVPIYSQKQFCKPRGFKEATLNHAYTPYKI